MTEGYENVVFEGGSSRGIVYVGALRALREKKILGGIKRFAGTSAGALVAALLALDFSVEEIYVAMKTLLGAMQDLGDGISLMELLRLYTSYGANHSDPIEEVLKEIIGKRHDPEITLKEAYGITGKYLVIVTCNVNRECPVYLHAKTFPNVKVVDALLASISIPFFFIPRKYDFLGDEDYYVDGGTVDNYPIWVFNDLEKLMSGNLGDMRDIDKDYIPPTTLGLKIMDPMEKNTGGNPDVRKEINSLVPCIAAVINSMILQIERAHISESYLKQTIGLRVPKMDFTDFKFSSQELMDLMDIGYKQVNEKLEKK